MMNESESEKISKRLMDVCAVGDTQSALSILVECKEESPKTQRRFETIAMHASAINNRTSTLLALLNLGIDVDAQNDQLKTALWHAVDNQNVEACALLIQKGANVNKINHHGMSMLYASATAGWQPKKKEAIEIVKLLLAAGADPFFLARTDKRNCLEAAIFNGETQQALLMIPSAAEKSNEASQYVSAFRHAARKNDQRVIFGLAACGLYVGDADPFNNFKDFENSALGLAIYHCNINAVLVFLAAGAGTGEEGALANSQIKDPVSPDYMATRLQAAVATARLGPELLGKALEQDTDPKTVVERATQACQWATEKERLSGLTVARSVIALKATNMAIQDIRAHSISEFQRLPRVLGHK